jgi:hypothetical protein
MVYLLQEAKHANLNTYLTTPNHVRLTKVRKVVNCSLLFISDMKILWMHLLWPVINRLKSPSLDFHTYKFIYHPSTVLWLLSYFPLQQLPTLTIIRRSIQISFMYLSYVLQQMHYTSQLKLQPMIQPRPPCDNRIVLLKDETVSPVIHHFMRAFLLLVDIDHNNAVCLLSPTLLPHKYILKNSTTTFYIWKLINMLYNEDYPALQISWKKVIRCFS